MASVFDQSILLTQASYSDVGPSPYTIGPVPFVICTDLTCTTVNGAAYPPPVSGSFADNTTFITHSTDATVRIGFYAGGTTGTTAIMSFAQTANRTYTWIDPGTDTEVLLAAGVQTLTNKSFVDNTTYFLNSTDATIRAAFDVEGTSGTTATIRTAQTANRIYTIPDSTVDTTFVIVDSTQTLANKSLYANSTFVVNATTPSTRINFDPEGLPNTLATIQTATVGNRTYTIPDSGGNASFVMTAGTQILAGKTFTDTTFAIVNTTDNTKQIAFNAAGNTTSAVATIATGAIAARTYTIPDSAGDTSFVMTAGTQILSNKYFTDTTSGFVNTADNTKQIAFSAVGNTTGIVATIATAAIAARTYTIPDSGASTSFIMSVGTQTLFNKALSDTTTTIVNAAITNKKIAFSAVGNAVSTTATIATTTAASRTYTIPDSGASTQFVMQVGAQTISNKSFTDTSTAIVNAVDATKQLNFTVVGNTTGVVATIATGAAVTCTYTIPDSGVSTQFVMQVGTQTVSGKSFTDTTTAIVNTADPTKQINFSAVGNVTGAVATIATAAGIARTYTIPESGASTQFVMQVGGQTVSNKSFTDTTTAIINTTDATKQIMFTAAGNATATVATIATATTASRTYTIPDSGASTQFVMLVGAQTVSNKSFGDAGTAIVNSTTASKKITFNAGGNAASTTATIATSTIANRTYTIPDSGVSTTFVMSDGIQILSGKSITDADPIVVNSADNTKQFAFNLAGSTSGTIATLVTNNTTTRNYILPDIPADDTFVMLNDTQTFSNKNFVDNATFIVSHTDATIRIGFSATGTTGTTTTLQTTQTANRIYSFPNTTVDATVIVSQNNQTITGTITMTGLITNTITEAVAGNGVNVDQMNVRQDAISLPVPNVNFTLSSIKAASGNISIGIIPSGTGSIMATIPDNTAAGGQTRGTNSVDLQLTRAVNSQVASGASAFIGGGFSNTAGGQYAVVSGGQANSSSGLNATIGGGISNISNANYTTVGGGNTNTASGNNATVAGGNTNTASGAKATVAGGEGNTAATSDATVGGGLNNSITVGADSTISGGNTNVITSDTCFIGGGSGNQASASTTTISGGSSNKTSAQYATVGGGTGNTASGVKSTVAGGGGNTASTADATVGGGISNSITVGVDSTIGGGNTNIITSDTCFIGGGNGNQASASTATIAGGSSNTASGQYSTVGGGTGNTAATTNSTVSGGNGNNISAGINATISGGNGNTISTQNSTIGGGVSNTISTNTDATISGGNTNKAQAQYATVGGGFTNKSSGASATVGGGDHNTASGATTTVAGGSTNTSTFQYCTVGGGYTNAASNTAATIAGGQNNTASGATTTIGGGQANSALNQYCTVSGGYTNSANGIGSTIAGGYNNTILSAGCTISGGNANNIAASSANSVIGGGVSNTVSGVNSGVFAGANNTADSAYAAVLGGNLCVTHAGYSSIGGGYNNIIDSASTAAVISGGWNNSITGATYAGVLSGLNNSSTGAYSVVVGGTANFTTSATYCVISGGSSNNIYAGANYCSINGGLSNLITAGLYSTIAGGNMNSIAIGWGFIGGGINNAVNAGTAGVVCGGNANTAGGTNAGVLAGTSGMATGTNATVVGGDTNTASGTDSAVLWGLNSTASNTRSAAGGRGAVSSGAGALTFTDNTNTTTTNANTNRAVFSFDNGYRFITTSAAWRLNNVCYKFPTFSGTTSSPAVGSVTLGIITLQTDSVYIVELRYVGTTTPTAGANYSFLTRSLFVACNAGVASITTQYDINEQNSTGLAGNTLACTTSNNPPRLRIVMTNNSVAANVIYTGCTTLYINDTNNPDPV